jgi:F0F1-type ATP synthase membrane subunit b/b'
MYYYLYKYRNIMPPEVQEAMAAGQEMLDKVKKKKEEFDALIGETQKKIDELNEKYVGRSKKFIDEKKKELTEELEAKKKIVEDKIKELTEQAQAWLDTKKEELTKKAAETATKILTGLSAPEIDPSDEN